MNELRYTLVSDGPGDKKLIPILSWLLHKHLPDCGLQPVWADLRELPDPPKDLAGRITLALDMYDCDLLFIHRDAEGQDPNIRYREIEDALGKIAVQKTPPAVCVVPVCMTEAWLLFDVAAIRRAAGNPNGKIPLSLPPLRELESLLNPKQDLYQMLRDASERRGRHLKSFRSEKAAYYISDHIDDFAPLRDLPAFVRLEKELCGIIERKHWKGKE